MKIGKLEEWNVGLMENWSDVGAGEFWSGAHGVGVRFVGAIFTMFYDSSFQHSLPPWFQYSTAFGRFPI